MKKYLSFLILAFLSIAIQAQSDFKKSVEADYQQMADYIKKKDYNSPIFILKGIENRYSLLPNDEKKNYDGLLKDIYYNLACCYAMTGKETEALVSLENAIKEGYVNYAHIKKDTDLDSLRDLMKFKELLEPLRQKGDYVYILQQSGSYMKEPPAFTYQQPADIELVKLKEYFNLDSIAGNGNEVSKILNLMTWSHNLIRHDGSYMPPVEERTAISFYEYVKKNDKGINCRALAIFLNECYLAMGFKSYFITCLPKNEDDPDCHVINSVYSTVLNKWIWIDPTFNAWVKDEKGNMLGIREVRTRIIEGLPVFINEEANWNNKTKYTKEMYIDSYMSKNLYWFNRSAKSEINTDMTREYNCKVALLPLNHYLKNRDSLTYYSHDDNYFWENQ
ncbi:transglutaminase domain-containing protein [uncultured Dysgonomonas sp.]|uniref:BCE-2095-like N-terminal domain-containing protein n=1 Tax=uncultured Dysgonomonas sp. TaxID=206096 RepID=A0A212IXI2_9BACT|nr:transglutaminase domain-containing protein [uncultured Dysgonomonas sp.]SBV91635.1 conserved exported hypothetical protein [uncultured Dysgonomonas sp.]